ncbi:MAG: hypothetical protein ABWZ25_17605 [Chitinophagaceae bacterium]
MLSEITERAWPGGMVVWVTHSGTIPDGDPAKSLPGDNKRSMMSSSFTISVDKDGVFTGVQQGKTTYTMAEWNKMMQGQPLDKNDGFRGYGGGDVGGSGAGGKW